MYSFTDIRWLMQEAQKEADRAYSLGEVPVGAVVVDNSKKIIGIGRNDKEINSNPCGHAEVNAIIDAAKNFGDWRLKGCTIFVTLEPCIMCMGSLIHARVDALYFGAYDKKAGAISLGYTIYNDKRLNHKFNVYGGIDHFANSKNLSNFFRAKRISHKK